jgi:hypothetical protein
VVSMLASGPPAEAVGFFRCGKNPQACLPSEGKQKYVSHVPALRHVKEPINFVNYGLLAKFLGP